MPLILRNSISDKANTGNDMFVYCRRILGRDCYHSSWSFFSSFSNFDEAFANSQCHAADAGVLVAVLLSLASVVLDYFSCNGR